MKYFACIISIAFIFTGCNQEDSRELSELKEKKDFYSSKVAAYRDSLIEINELIALKDTLEEKFKYVTLLEATPATYEHYFEVHGNVDADKNVMIYPSTAGQVKRISTSEGKRVKAGDVLAELDADIIISSIQEVNTQLSLAKEVFERQERLWDQKIGSEMQYLQAKTNKESLERKIASLNEQLQMSKIVAPFDGYIEEVFVKKGEMAAPQMPFLRLINTENVKINCDISEDYIDKIVRGNLVKVSVPGSNQEFEAFIAIKGEFINPHNRTFKCVIDIKDNKYQLKPNQLCKLRIRDEWLENKVIVPDNLVQEDREGNAFIYLYQNGEVEKRAIQVGSTYRNQTVVIKGINQSVKLINKGSRIVQEGEKVKIINPEA